MHGLSWARRARQRCKESLRCAQPLRYQNICRYRQLRVVVKRAHAIVFIVSICCLSIARRVTLAPLPRLTNARPAPAVKEPLRWPLKTGRRLPGYPIISTEFPQAGACRRTDEALRAGRGWQASPTAQHSWPGSDSDGQKMEPLLFRADCAAVAGGYHRDCLLQYQAVPPCEKPRAPPLRTRPGCS